MLELQTLEIMETGLQSSYIVCLQFPTGSASAPPPPCHSGPTRALIQQGSRPPPLSPVKACICCACFLLGDQERQWVNHIVMCQVKVWNLFLDIFHRAV